MRILYHSWEFGSGTGGIGQYLYQMACGVREYGHEVVVVAGDGGSGFAVEKKDYGIVYRSYAKDDIRQKSVAHKVLSIAEKHNVNAIEGTDHLGECAKIIAFKSRPPVVIKYHGCQIIRALTSAEIIYPWQRITVAAALLKIRKQCEAERICVEKADAAIAPSEKIRQDLLSQNTSIPSQFQLVPNMLSSLPELSNDNEAFTPTLLYVGRIEIRKGIQYLPDIFRRISVSFPNVVLEIAGGDQYARGLGSLKEWLRKKMGNLSERVRFLGPLSPTELDEAYRRCWTLVFPTKWDNFPMAVLEAMAYGKPVITTTNGGMPEMLSGTGSPIADPNSDDFSQQLIHLIGDKRLRREIGDKCREKVLNNFMPNQVIPEYLKFIETVK